MHSSKAYLKKLVGICCKKADNNYINSSMHASKNIAVYFTQKILPQVLKIKFFDVFSRWQPYVETGMLVNPLIHCLLSQYLETFERSHFLQATLQPDWLVMRIITKELLVIHETAMMTFCFEHEFSVIDYQIPVLGRNLITDVSLPTQKQASHVRNLNLSYDWLIYKQA